MLPRFALPCVLFLVLQIPPLPAEARGVADRSVKLFDTGTASPAPLSGGALSRRTGWTKLPEDETTHRFSGDAVFTNDRLAVVLRPGGPGAEVYANGPKGLSLRAVLTPVGGGGDVKLASVAIVENQPGEVVLDATFHAPHGKSPSLRYALGIGRVFVRTEARHPIGGASGCPTEWAAGSLRIEAPCRFVVLPDFFADDIVVDATEIPATTATAELPSENFLLHMLGEGEAIVMSVSDTRQQDALIRLSGRDARRVIRYSEIYYGKKGKVWVAVLEDPGVWHRRDVADEEAGKILPLDWKAPFAAQWRVDWRRDDGLSDSWEMLTQKPSGEYIKHGWFGQPESFGTPDWMNPNRQRWTTVLGRFQYPCWIDRSGRGYLQPLQKKMRFRGPAVIYPINRLQATPLDRFTVVDTVRATLGVGPCEYILDVEGQRKQSQGIATCAARDKLNGIYQQKLQKQKKREVEKALVDVLAFVQHIRARIEDYVVFGHKMLDYLAAQKKAHPELAEPLADMETLTRKIDDYVAQRKEGIGTPAEAVELIEAFRTKLVDYEGDDALQQCQKFGKAITRIGGSQDELVGECRMAVKILRQRAGLAMAIDPRTAEFAKEIRRRTREILRNPTSYEAPRH